MASTTYQRIALTFSTPFAKHGGAQQQWDLNFSLSGTQILNQADALATALDLASVPLSFCNSTSYLQGWLYYPQGSASNTFGGTFNPTDHPGTKAAYSSPGNTSAVQLEVCVLIRAPVGHSVKGRAKYLYKHVHDPLMSNSQAGQIAPTNPASTVLAKWNTGSGPNNVRPCSPSDGTIGTWAWSTALYTRQMRRGVKKKASP